MKNSSRGVSLAFALASLAKIAFIVSCVMQFALLLRAPVSPAEAHANDARHLAIARLNLPLALIAIIVFQVWFYRTKRAVIEAGMVDPEYSPGLSVGCFYIPIANFILPFKAMRELWKGSVNPRDWKARQSSPLVGWWWASWVAYSLAPFAASAYSKTATGIDGLKVTTILFALFGMLAVMCFVLTAILAGSVSARFNQYTSSRDRAGQLNKAEEDARFSLVSTQSRGFMRKAISILFLILFLLSLSGLMAGFKNAPNISVLIGQTVFILLFLLLTLYFWKPRPPKSNK